MNEIVNMSILSILSICACQYVSICACQYVPVSNSWVVAGKEKKTNLFKICKPFFLLQIIFSASSLDSLAPEVHPRPVVGAALHPRLGADVQVALIHRGARVPGDP